MSKKINFKIPFDQFGNQHVYNCHSFRQYEKDNYEFDAIILFLKSKPSRSGIHVYWSDEHGKQYVSSMRLLEEVLNGNYPFIKVDNRLAIQGTFTFEKQGSSVFLKLKK